MRRRPHWWRAALGGGEATGHRPLAELVALGLLAVVIVVVALAVFAVVVVTFWPEVTALAVVLGCALAARHVYRWKGRAPQHERAPEQEANTVGTQARRPLGTAEPDDPEAF